MVTLKSNKIKKSFRKIKSTWWK